METKLKEFIKEAVLEALVEFTNGSVQVTSGDEEIQGGGNTFPEHEDNDGNNNNNNNNGGNSGQGGGSADNSGGTPSGDGRPKPNVGVGVWSMRP